MTETGSLPEGQELFRCEAKPQDRFRDRASTPLMTGNGWFSERLLLQSLFEYRMLLLLFVVARSLVGGS